MHLEVGFGMDWSNNRGGQTVLHRTDLKQYPNVFIKIHFFPFFFLNLIRIIYLFGEDNERNSNIITPFPFHIFAILQEVSRIMDLDIMAEMMPLSYVFEDLFPHGLHVYQEIWPILAMDPT